MTEMRILRRKIYNIVKEAFTFFSLVYFTALSLERLCRVFSSVKIEIVDNETSLAENLHYKTHTERLEKLFEQTVLEYEHVYQETYYPILQGNITFEGGEILDKESQSKYSHPQCISKNFLLVLIHSAPENIKRRLAIRYSWGMSGNVLSSTGRRKQTSGAFKSQTSFRYFFVLGKTNDKGIEHTITKEIEEYGDIVQVNVYDHYRNLTQKTMLSFEWVKDHCPSKFILKTDDDCFLNVDVLALYLKKMTKTPKTLYTGRVQWAMPANRENSSKFYVSYDVYKELLLAPYASGGGYIFAGRLIHKLLEVNRYVKPIPIEDAHIGLLMKNIGVKPVENRRILPYIYCNESSIWNRPPCDFSEPLLIHGVENFAQIWMYYHVTILNTIPGICKQGRWFRKKKEPRLFCPVNLEL